MAVWSPLSQTVTSLQVHHIHFITFFLNFSIILSLSLSHSSVSIHSVMKRNNRSLRSHVLPICIILILNKSCWRSLTWNVKSHIKKFEIKSSLEPSFWLQCCLEMCPPSSFQVRHVFGPQFKYHSFTVLWIDK